MCMNKGQGALLLRKRDAVNSAAALAASNILATHAIGCSVSLVVIHPLTIFSDKQVDVITDDDNKLVSE